MLCCRRRLTGTDAIQKVAKRDVRDAAVTLTLAFTVFIHLHLLCDQMLDKH